MKRLIASLLFFFAATSLSYSQVVTTEPEFPTSQDSVIIYFDATQGTGNLADYNGEIYAHTGVITAESGDEWVNAPQWGDNAEKYQLTQVESNIYKLEISPSIYEYYGISENTTVEQMAFVFRNSDGSVQTNDLFAEVYQNQYNVKFIQPADSVSFVKASETMTITGIASTESELTLSIDGQSVKTVTDDTLEYDFQPQNEGKFALQLRGASSSNQDSLTSELIAYPQQTDQNRPQGLQDGITYVDNNTIRLSLFAPYKEFVYLVGDFTNWKVQPQYLMNRDVVNSDSTYYWIEFDVPSGSQEYGFQYLVDGKIRIADPYSEKVLQPDDQYISEQTYPNLKPYPSSQTNVSVGVLQPGKEEYNWQHTNYNRPEKENLVVYELLLRDFVADHDFETLTDTLDYLDRLGVNAIELMPVMEFEGNSSWGYNTAFHFATDKYYGPARDLKKFIDEAHSRNIAVILDVVLNHVYGQSPLVRLWNDGTYGQPTSENPYLNVQSPNQTYSWGYDFNHESAATKYYVDRVTQYWMQEFNADGFRFDFTKGFTQNPGDGWAYDSDRIRLLKRMADQQWAVDDSSFVILEHLTTNQEEKELSNYGMMLWGNLHYSYNEATMGYHDNGKSNFSGISYQNRGWDNPHLVGYMESHDEERMMYNNLQFGNSDGSYDITELNTALNRNKMAAAFFFTVPGPKMIWQFGELGYDKSINLCEDGTISEACRLSPKPILWEYYENNDRKKLYDTFKALIRLRNTHPTFTSGETEITMDVANAAKRITLSHPDMEVSIVGNFGVQAMDISPNFAQTGSWYEYFSGDTLNISNTDTSITLQAGEFHIYTTQKFQEPDSDLITIFPSQIAVDISQSFSSASSAEDYRLVALPGQSGIALSNVMSGESGVTWQAYWDNGNSSDYLVKYDGSDTFTFTAGKGFWATSKEKFAYNNTVSTVDLNEKNQASIPLHDGWNIISNPLHVDISWNTVSEANGGNLQPLWRFDGSYSQAAYFVSARSGEAFYFLNDKELDNLLIPYKEKTSKEKPDATQNEIRLITSVNGEKTSSSKLTFVRSEEHTPANIVAPPSGFEGASLRFVMEGPNKGQARVNSFAQIYRSPSPEGHRIKLTLSATPKEPVIISSDGLDKNTVKKIVLLNPNSGRNYDLGNGQKAKIIPQKEETSLLLLVGDTSFINEQQEQFLPKKIQISPNYPNPFNPSTTLKFSLPEQTEVRLQVYNVLGQQVSTLISNEVREAGVHTVTFDGSNRASGMYFAVFEIGNRRFIQKMTLIK